jgi:hypothetical protein
MTVVFLLVCCAPVSAADAEARLNGRVAAVDLASKTVVVVSYDGQRVTLSVEDEPTLAKFRDGRIKIDDDVKVKYVSKEGRNVATSLKKPAGC